MKIKTALISTLIISSFSLGMLPTIVKASTTTIPIKEVDGKKYVSLTDLTNANGGTIVDNSEVGVKTFNINGKVIITNTNTAFITVDDKTIPYESKEIDGIKVPNFQANKPKADNGEILFPITILADYVGMKPTDEGFVIEKAEENDVPIVYNKELSDLLCNVDIGEYIPSELYEAVAHIIAYVADLDKNKNI